MEIILLTEFGELLPLEQWQCSMMMCPSQCYYRTQKDGIDYVLYLRWRWDDPWQAHIIKNADSENAMSADAAEWSNDIFEANNVFFLHDEVEQAKEKLVAMFLSGLPTLLALDEGDSADLPGDSTPEDLSGLGSGSTPALRQ